MSKELADRLEWIDEARQIAAQCWCDPETEQKIMDPVLAEAIAKRIALWMETGAQHAKNEEYWRERATKAEESIAALRSEPVYQQDALDMADNRADARHNKLNIDSVEPVAGQLSAEQDYKSVWKPDELERIIDQYVKHYELNDGESTYDPSDEERIVIKDAIMGLLVDREWDNEWGKHIAALSSRRGTFADGIEAAAKLADANGGLQIRWFASEIRALAQDQRECNPAPMHGQSKTWLTESHSGAPTQDADELLREATDALDNLAEMANMSVYDKLIRQLRAHLSRKEQ